MSNDVKSLNVDEMIDQFVGQLVTEAGMDKDIEADVLTQLKKDLRERLDNRINAALLSQIPEHKLEELEKLLDTKDARSIQSFYSENIPNMTELIASELLGFRKRYIV